MRFEVKIDEIAMNTLLGLESLDLNVTRILGVELLWKMIMVVYRLWIIIIISEIARELTNIRKEGKRGKVRVSQVQEFLENLQNSMHRLAAPA